MSLIIRSPNCICNLWFTYACGWPPVVKSEWEIDYGRSPHAYVNQRLQIQLGLLMMSDIPLETCWASDKLRNNKFRYQVASCWLLLLNIVLSSETDKFLYDHDVKCGRYCSGNGKILMCLCIFKIAWQQHLGGLRRLKYKFPATEFSSCTWIRLLMSLTFSKLLENCANLVNVECKLRLQSFTGHDSSHYLRNINLNKFA